jgi:hypothetical protein
VIREISSVSTLHGEKLSRQRRTRCAAHLQAGAAQGCQKFRNAGPFSQRQTQRCQTSRERRFGVVVHAGDVAAGQIEHRERLQDVIELSAGEIDVHFLTAAHAPKMLEVSHAVLVEHYTAYRESSGRYGFRGVAARFRCRGCTLRTCCNFALILSVTETRKE